MESTNIRPRFGGLFARRPQHPLHEAVDPQLCQSLERNDALSEEIAALKKQNASQIKRIEELELFLKAGGLEPAMLEQVCQERDRQIALLKEGNVGLIERLQKADSGLAQKQTETEQLQEQLARVTRERDDAVGENNQLKNDLVQLSSNYNQGKAHLCQVLDELDHYKAEAIKMREQMETLAKQELVLADRLKAEITLRQQVIRQIAETYSLVARPPWLAVAASAHSSSEQCCFSSSTTATCSSSSLCQLHEQELDVQDLE